MFKCLTANLARLPTTVHVRVCTEQQKKTKNNKKECFYLPTSPVYVHGTSKLCGYLAFCRPGLLGPFCVFKCVCMKGVRGTTTGTHGSEQSSGPSLFEAVSEPAASDRTRPDVTMTALRCSSSPVQPFAWVPSMCWIA